MAVPPPIPALPDAPRITLYAITASVGPLGVGFALYGDGTDYTNWIQVYVNGILQSGTAYTLTSPSGAVGSIARPITDGVITFNAAQTGDVVIVGARRPRRVTQANENQGVSARDFNQTVTDLVAMQREAWDFRSRVIQGIPGDVFPIFGPTQRASSALGFDATGALTLLPLTSAGPISITSTAFFNTRGLAAAATIDGSIQFLFTAGFSAAGDLGGSLYTKVGGSTIGGFQSVDGAWWALANPALCVQMFGAKGDGVTDDTAAINLAISYVNAASRGRLLFPRGVYLVSTLNTITGPVNIEGDGPLASVIMTSSATGTVMTHAGTGVISNIGFDSNVTKTAGYHLWLSGNTIAVENVWSKHAYVGIYNTGRVNRLHSCNIELMTSRNVAANSGGVLNEGGILNITQTSCAGSTSVNANMPEYGFKGLANVNGGEIDLFDSYVFQCNYGVIAVSSATGPFNGLMIGNCWFDSTISGSILVDSTPGNSNSPTWISNCWCAPGTNGGTVVAAIEFRGNTTGDAIVSGNHLLSYNNGSGIGLYINGVGGRQVECTGNLIGGLGVGFGTGFQTANGALGWSLVGGRVHGNTTGIAIGTTNNIYTIDGVAVVNNSASVANNSPAALTFRIGLCPGIDIIAPGSAAGFTWDNEGRITAHP